MPESRESKLRKAAEAQGFRLEKGNGYRLVGAVTGTLVAADWTSADGYGLTLNQVEAALT